MILFETEWYECNDWYSRHLGNCPKEDYEINKKIIGHEYKNLDYNLKHNLNRSINNIDVIIKFENGKRNKIINGIEIQEIDKNTLKIKTFYNFDEDGYLIMRDLLLDDGYIMNGNEEAFYKIIIKG